MNDWQTQRKEICKLLNVGYGDIQVRADEHVSRSIKLKEGFESNERNLDKDLKRSFKLFQDSTKSRKSGRGGAKDEEFAREETTSSPRCFSLFHSLSIPVRSNSQMLSWPNTVHFL
jgi:hypothetical protein